MLRLAQCYVELDDQEKAQATLDDARPLTVDYTMELARVGYQLVQIMLNNEQDDLQRLNIALELAQAKQAGAITGWPDLIVLPPSHVGPVFFEVKAEGNYPTDAQRRVHDQLRALGYRVGIVRSVDDVKERLADWGIWFSRGAA
jgi:hypothetical protein